MSEEKPKYFYQTDRGKIVGHCIHDINGATGLAGAVVNRLVRESEAGNSPNENFLDDLKIIKERLKKVSAAVDYLYSGLKKLEGY